MTDRVAEALRLRTWAIRVLSSGWAGPPDVGPPAWQLFLGAERCAIALSTRAEGDAPPLLHARATVELQRILSARAQLEELGREVAAAGDRVVVLKGGIMALGSPVGVDLADVDILAEPPAALRIAALLDSRGYQPGPRGSTAHLPQRSQPFAVHIEVHHSLVELPAASVWARAEPVPGRAGLWRPASVDQVRHALVHCAFTHPFRRGALRDLLFIGWADAGLDGRGRDQVAEWLREDARREVLTAVLRLARDLRDHRAPVDTFRREAAAHYLLAGSTGRGGDWGLRSSVARSVYSRLDGSSARKAYWTSVWAGSVGTSPWPLLASVEAAWPAGGRILRRALRLARLPFVEAAARRIARRAGNLGQLDPVIDARTFAIRSGAA